MIRLALLQFALVALLSGSATLHAAPAAVHLQSSFSPILPTHGVLAGSEALLADSLRVTRFDLSAPTTPLQQESHWLPSVVSLAGQGGNSWLLQRDACLLRSGPETEFQELPCELDEAFDLAVRADSAWVLDSHGLHCITTLYDNLIEAVGLRSLCAGPSQVWVIDEDTLYACMEERLQPVQASSAQKELLCDTGSELLALDANQQLWRLQYGDQASGWRQDSLANRLVVASYWKEDLVWAASSAGELLCLSLRNFPARVLRTAFGGGMDLSICGDTLLSAGPASSRLMRAVVNSGGGVEVQLLGQLCSNPLPLKAMLASWRDTQTCWLLDENIGWRVLDPTRDWSEVLRVPQPAPVLDGDFLDGVLATCSGGNGLRYHELMGDSLYLRGLHFNDELAYVSLGPGGLIAYVTPDGYVAIKGIARSPWELQHFGHLPTHHLPSAVCWMDSLLLIGSADGTLSVVDARDVLQPETWSTISLDDPIISLDSRNDVLLLVTPDEARLLGRLEEDSFMELESWPASSGHWTGGCLAEGVLLMQKSPNRLLWYPQSTWESLPIVVELPQAPRLLTCDTEGSALLVDESGTVTQLLLQQGESAEATRLLCYPNPTMGSLQLRLRATSSGSLRLTVHDLLGRELLRQKHTLSLSGIHELQLQLGSLPAGLYLLSCKGCGIEESCAVLLR